MVGQVLLPGTMLPGRGGSVRPILGRVTRTLLVAALFTSSLAAAPAGGEQAPQRARIAYSNAGSIWTIAADGSDRHRITTGHEDDDPGWSTDGLIAFTRAFTKPRGYLPARASIWVVGADGTGAHELVSAGNGSLSAPAWAPDGQTLAYTRHEVVGEDLVTSIELVLRDGSERRTVVSALASATDDTIDYPAWAPDGSHLLFTRRRFADDQYLRTVHSVALDGTGERQLIRNGGSADFSPDGTRIVYSDYRDRHGETCGEDDCWANGEIAIVNADGSGRRVLTHNDADDATPRWSPDGSRVLFHSGRNVRSNYPPDELYSIAPDGACLTWLTNGTPESRRGDWRPGPGSTDPGACGEAGRGPLSEIQPPHSLRGAIWLGPRFGNALLVETEGNGRRAAFFYGDCAAFTPAECPPTIGLTEQDTCARSTRSRLRAIVNAILRTELPRNRARFIRARRAPSGALVSPNEDVIVAGRSLIDLGIDLTRSNAEYLRVRRQIAAALRPVPRTSRGWNATPVLPQSIRDALPEQLRRHVRRCRGSAETGRR